MWLQTRETTMRKLLLKCDFVLQQFQCNAMLQSRDKSTRLQCDSVSTEMVLSHPVCKTQKLPRNLPIRGIPGKNSKSSDWLSWPALTCERVFTNSFNGNPESDAYVEFFAIRRSHVFKLTICTNSI